MCIRTCIRRDHRGSDNPEREGREDRVQRHRRERDEAMPTAHTRVQTYSLEEEQLTAGIGRIGRSGSMPALIVFVTHVLTSIYEKVDISHILTSFFPVTKMKAYLISAFLLLLVQHCSAIECYTGLKLIAGQSLGSETIQCDNSNAYCYNMTANAANVVDVLKAGCSLWRCMFARDKCISTVFQNIPISLCCCSTNRCNVGGSGGFQKQVIGGWNAKPEQGQNHEVKKQWTKDEVAAKFRSADLDDDHPVSTTRGNRHSTQGEIEIP
ncbi:hypothetical protein RB195_006934 [Necator americanus]|uniref:ET module n=1 Tax=Necator americanus TaxID=51031 RepID=A0ABR1BWL3_NECAM